MNCEIIIREKSIFNPQRWLMLFAARGFIKLLNRFGWTPYQFAYTHQQEENNNE